MMRCWIGFGLALAVLPQDKPYADPSRHPRTYEGPGREEPEPKDVHEVLIGYFGPSDPAHPVGGMLWQGATLAIDEANRGGGYRGLPFRLVPAWSENPWSGGPAQLVRAVYTDKVWAIVGGIDGATTHLAEQVVAKAQVPLVNPAGTDRGIHAANVPWIFSVPPGDHLQAPLLREAVKRADAPYAIFSATDHDSRAFLAELKLTPALHVEFEPGAQHPAALAERLAGVKAVVVVAGAPDTTRVIQAIRATGFTGLVFSRASLLLAEIAPDFRARFVTRFGRQPDAAAAHAYDAVTLVVAAIRKTGLNRARLRDAIQALSPYQGVSGRIEWDALGRNTRPPRLLP
jgi:branched-chain amino acid transport system substrate-binding protein